MTDNTTPTLLWSAQLRDAHWRCELAEEHEIWYARLYRNGELTAWYQAETADAALRWADALAAIFAADGRTH